MSSIYTVTQAINVNAEVEDLYQMYQRFLTSYLGLDDIVLYMFEDGWKQVICKHSSIKESDINVALAVHYKKASRIEDSDRDSLGGYTYIIPVYHKDVAISFALLGEINCQSVESKVYLIQYAQVVTNIITMAVENKRLFKRELEKKEFDKEMELASRVQGMIIPKRLPKNHIYEFAGLYLPHRSIGGDYYDVININKDEFVFCMGDISGKGVAAALVMANLQSYLNASPPVDMDNGRELVDRLNSKILSITNGDKFITLFIAKYNILTRELHYLNAGHNPPVLINGDEVIKLDKGCALLGILEQIPKVQTGKLILKPGALVVTYTDGLTDLENTAKEIYGEQRLKHFTVNNYTKNAEDFVKSLFASISDFKGEVDFNDDVSVLVGKFL